MLSRTQSPFCPREITTYRFGWLKAAQAGLMVLVLSATGAAADKTLPPLPIPPPLLLEGGRRLEFVRSFSTEQDAKNKRSLLGKVFDFIAGPAELSRMVRPYGVVTDAQDRVIVTDPGAALVHIFDFTRRKYQKLEGSSKEPFRSPIGIAVDGTGNIYVADSELGKVLVFDNRGKFRRYIGNVKGEGYFKRPTGLAVDSAHGRLYVTDTLRDAVYYTDLQGNILGHFGKRGSGDGEFNYPTEILFRNDELFVVDAMNFRVQVFDRNGQYLGRFGQMGPVTGYLWRSKGLAMDSEAHFYLADAYLDVVQVFDRDGGLLYYFGKQGQGPGQFELPAGVCIDGNDRVFVVDTFNRRVEVFQYKGIKTADAKAGRDR
jgi:DNA-binding beta-propeller fold protein YncE